MNVIQWGEAALYKRPIRNKDNSNRIVVEFPKLHLGNLSDNLQSHLPDGLNYKKAISDYLREIREV
jgi:hypothetical protein